MAVLRPARGLLNAAGMRRTAWRVGLAATTVVVLAAGLWVWVVYSRNRINADRELNVVQARRPGLRISDTLRSDVRAFYDRRELAPMWISDAALTPKVAAALNTLDAARAHGLNPDDYDASGLRRDYDIFTRTATGANATGTGIDTLMHFDVRLTSALLSLGHDVSVGRTSPAALDPTWQAQRTPPDLPRTLAAAIDADITQWLAAIQPRHAEYAALQAALADEAGLAATGVDNAAAVVAANLERWRWMPDDLGARHLIVNIPGYTLLAREDGVTKLSMKVVVGKAATNQTPVLSSVMSTLVFSPTWSIPASIIANETVPAILRDPTYLRRQNIDVTAATATGVIPVDAAALGKSSAAQLRQYFYRQRSGPGNALGQIKFPFPNVYDVYLHDTPPDGAFSRATRALSHGCVRLEHPRMLAEYLLDGQKGWTPAKISKAMASGKEQYVKFPAPLPVHLVYFTAIVDANGALTILPDIYGYDGPRPSRQARTPIRPSGTAMLTATATIVTGTKAAAACTAVAPASSCATTAAPAARQPMAAAPKASHPAATLPSAIAPTATPPRLRLTTPTVTPPMATGAIAMPPIASSGLMAQSPIAIQPRA